LQKAMPGSHPDSIKPSKINGLSEITLGPKVFYMSDDGKYVIQGSLIDVQSKSDLTEPRLAQARVGSLNKVGLDKMIVFKPKTAAKHAVYVFTDIDCGYCRKLHSEMDQYLNQGIEIRYLFFPRAGEGSNSWDKAVAVWCAGDRQEALTKAKQGTDPDLKKCDNPVKQHMELGSALGAQGTPMLVTENGTELPGYVPALQLARILDQEAQKK
jgi:thiol:disulfide interchange protein DsbC